MEKISIIVPLYNKEQYISDCIESILSQNYKNFELILVNDGSEDKSLEMCYRYDDKRIKIYNLNHSGVSNARNYGLAHASGKYVCFIDSDDIIAKNYLEYLYNLIKLYNADIAEVDFCYLGKKIINNKKINFYNYKDMLYRLYTNDGVRTGIITNKLFNIRLFDNIKFEAKTNEDDFIVHKLIIKAKNGIVVSNNKLYFYRILKNSYQRNFNINKINVLDVFKERDKLFSFDKELKRLNYIASMDMIIYLYCLCLKNDELNILRTLKLKFDEKYKKNKYKLNLKRKIKYIVFYKYPILASRIILKNKRFNYA